MAIGERSYPRDELSDRARQALRTAATMVADELFEDVRDLASSARTLEDSNAWFYLPAKYRPRYTPLFVQQFLVCVVVVGWKLFDEQQEHRLDCLAEELALKAILTCAQAVVEIEDGEPVDFGYVEDLAYEDVDFEALFDPSQDGVEDTHVGRDVLGMTHLNFSEWFLPFSRGYRVHPYVDQEPG
jgi:hypothetical protein